MINLLALWTQCIARTNGIIVGYGLIVYIVFFFLGVATQTSVEMVSVSCQTEMSGADLLRMERELQEVHHQVCELHKRTQSWRDNAVSPAEQILKYSHS